MLMLVKVIGAYGYAKDKHEYCSRNFLRQKAMTEIQKLRKQLSRCLNVPFIEIIKPFNGNQILLLQQCIMLGYIDQIGVRDERTNSYRLMGEGNENEAYIHPSSCLFSKSPKYVVFGELLKTTKVYMKNLTMIPDALKMHFQ
jgi:ATP-dependent RNA helicase DHX37/DHR1